MPPTPNSMRRNNAGVRLLLAALCLLPAFANAQSLAERIAIPLGLKGPLQAASGTPASIPGFRRLGTSLVGTVRTEDGTSVRLIFDARSLRLIGMKPVHQLHPAQQGCIGATVEAPLPLRASKNNPSPVKTALPARTTPAN